jgi:hypothetical protein
MALLTLKIDGRWAMGEAVGGGGWFRTAREKKQGITRQYSGGLLSHAPCKALSEDAL